MRPIDAEELYADIVQIAKAKAKSDAQKSLIGRILFVIEGKPTIEAKPVRHGHWIAVSAFDACGGDEEVWMAHGNPIAYHYCSECKNETYLNEEGKEILSDYCPFCGADMREVNEDVGTD